MHNRTELFESLSELSARMLAAARANDWDSLCELESATHPLRDALTQQPVATSPLDDDNRAQQIRLIQKMLAEDREIRSHAQPWMDDVKTLLAGQARRTALNNSYGISSR